MAHLWMYRDPDDAWLAAGLEGSRCGVAVGGPFSLDDRTNGGAEAAVMLIGRQDGPEEEWVLLAPFQARVWVNGTPLALGIRVLRERDEIQVQEDGAPGRRRRFYFSTERRAAVEPYPGTDTSARCARCKRPIVKDTPAVRCPQCGAWHHQAGQWLCWTYDRKCAFCKQPTDTGTGFRWTPEGM